MVDDIENVRSGVKNTGICHNSVEIQGIAINSPKRAFLQVFAAIGKFDVFAIVFARDVCAPQIYRVNINIVTARIS
jgi:hypothetical protein